MVTDKMITAVWEILNKQMHKYKYPYEVATQEAINAAWTEFDHDDETTWPRKMGYFYVNGGLNAYWANQNSWEKWQKDNVTHYATPQDLMFKGDK